MQTKRLTYVGPDSMGPHYLESGKRPTGDKTRVTIQREDGTRVPGTWFADEQAFYSEGGWTVPVCWWHLPQPMPMTEREWWMAQYWHGKEGVFRYRTGNLAYTHCYGESELITNDGIVNLTAPSLKEAKSAAYDHWVAAGRP